MGLHSSFAGLQNLKYPALNPYDTRSHTYFVDGKAMVRDIQVAHNGDYLDWKTILVTGMGQGGKTYLNMDVTNPADPKMLWEFGDSVMGRTEAKPLIVDMFDGTETFPAVVMAGGYNMQEVPADTTEAVPLTSKLEGKALYIVKAQTGDIVKKFVYDPSNSNSNTLYTSPDLKYAMASSPVLYDSNNDGLADYMYICDTGDYSVSAHRGGAIWKIPCYGTPNNWVPTKIFQCDDGQTIYMAPTLSLDRNYRLWVMFGTGRRSKPASTDAAGNYNNLTGQFFAFIDDAVSVSAYPLTTSLLTDVTSNVLNATSYSFTLSGSNRGLYTNLIRADHEIVFEPQPLFVDGRLYFTTYAPVGTGGGGGTIGDPCSGSSNSAGSHYTYKLGITSTGSGVDFSTPVVTNEKILGYGTLSGKKFKIYFGGGGVGGFGAIPGADITLHYIFSPLFWKEDNR